ncbi:MAG: NUDIX domain-containing protein [Minisyncoccia bacterium]
MVDPNTFSQNSIDFSGAKGLIFLKDKIILIRRDTKTTSFPLMVDIPGGAREISESPFDTFQREVFEELGIQIEKENIIYSKIYPSVIDPEKNRAFFLVTRELNINVSDIVFGDEGVEYLLLTPEEYVTLHDGIPGQQKRVADYLDFLAEQNI